MRWPNSGREGPMVWRLAVAAGPSGHGVAKFRRLTLLGLTEKTTKKCKLKRKWWEPSTGWQLFASLLRLIPDILSYRKSILGRRWLVYHNLLTKKKKIFFQRMSRLESSTCLSSKLVRRTAKLKKSERNLSYLSSLIDRLNICFSNVWTNFLIQNISRH